MAAAKPEELIAAFEAERARALGHEGRRGAAVYYTPPAIAAQVVELAQRHGARGVVLDPCAGAGAFLLAAARAGFSELRGIDEDASALRVARRALSGFRVRLRHGDALELRPRGRIDCIVSNPPYGHVPKDAALAQRYPALRGGEVDRYAVFMLRALELLPPEGVAALLVPDTWMFLSRAFRFREEVLHLSQVAAAVDLGKPFAAAKDTRVMAVVLVRKPAAARATCVARGQVALSKAPRADLVAQARRGFCLYRTPEERALCEAMEAAAVPLGQACEVGYGMRTGDNRRHVERRAPLRGEVALAGGEDVTPFALRWKPKALVHAEDLQALVERQRGRLRVAVQRIRTNAQAPWARWLEAAPVPPEVVCLDSLSTLAGLDEGSPVLNADRLWALLALVQSVALQRYHRLRTTDVNVKPSALRELPVPRRLLDDPRELAELSRARARCSRPRDGEAGVLPLDRSRAIDRLIDARVYASFGLSTGLVEACERGFWAGRYDEENQRLLEAVSDPSARVARTGRTA